MSTKTSSYSRALMQEALSPWLDELRAVNRTLRTELRGTNLSEAALGQHLPQNLRPTLRRLLQLMAREGDLGKLGEVIAEMEQFMSEGGTVQMAQVTSAIELSDEERLKLEGKLRQRFGADLLFEYEVDPSILGGIRVRVGDQVIDASLANRFNAIRERMTG